MYFNQQMIYQWISFDGWSIISRTTVSVESTQIWSCTVQTIQPVSRAYAISINKTSKTSRQTLRVFSLPLRRCIVNLTRCPPWTYDKWLGSQLLIHRSEWSWMETDRHVDKLKVWRYEEILRRYLGMSGKGISSQSVGVRPVVPRNHGEVHNDLYEDILCMFLECMRCGESYLLLNNRGDGISI